MLNNFNGRRRPRRGLRVERKTQTYRQIFQIKGLRLSMTPDCHLMRKENSRVRNNVNF